LSSESSDGFPPHAAYILPGKMKIGNATSVPAINSMQHSFAAATGHAAPASGHKFAASPPRSESLRSSSGGHSDSFSYQRNRKSAEAAGNGGFGSEADSERESISPPRHLLHHDEVRHQSLQFFF
jgi:hypothetical protein